MTADEITKGSTLLATLNVDNFPFGMYKDLIKDLNRMINIALDTTIVSKHSKTTNKENKSTNVALAGNVLCMTSVFNGLNRKKMIEYDKDFQKVMDELQANFEWSNIGVLPESYKDLLNDTIRAVKNCAIHDVVGKKRTVLSCDCDGQPLRYNELGICKYCGKHKSSDG